MDSELLVFDVQLEVNTLKGKVEAIPIWNAPRGGNAGSPATITSQQI